MTIVSTNFCGTSRVDIFGKVSLLKAHSFMGSRSSVCTRGCRNVGILSYVTTGGPGMLINATPRTSC